MSRPSSRRRPAALVVETIQPLEPRRLMAATTIEGAAQEVATQVAPIQANLTTPSANDVTLGTAFTDANVPGTLVEIQTSKGNIELSLTDTATPLTVANFLSYVTNDSYNDTIFHRSANLSDSTGVAPITSTDPATIIQGGGYSLSSAGITPITAGAPVADEFSTEEYGDIAGTIAMAKPGNSSGPLPDSATDQWFINSSDNTELDTVDDVNGINSSYTVFGKVLAGMDVVTTIASLPTANLTLADDSTTPAPIAGLTQSQINGGASIGADNLVFVNDVLTGPSVTYTVTSSAPSVVNPTITNGVLSFTYGAGTTGTAAVTVTATNVVDNTTATQTISVTVPPATSTTTGPVAAVDTVANVVSGVATPVNPLTNDTDATDPLDPTSLAVVTAPAHGTATVDPATGAIDYTATAGYTGTDTFTYAVKDTGGFASAATAVTLDVIAAPATVSIGAGTKVGAIAFTQPDGVKGTLRLSSGSAAVTFSAGALTTTVRDGVEVVSGAGATISDVVVTNNSAKGLPSLTIGSSGKGTVTLGGLSDAAGMVAVIAPTTTFTGEMNLAGLRQLVLAAADHATMVIGAASGTTAVSVPTANDTTLDGGAITTFRAKNWTDDDGGSYQLYVSSITNLLVTGSFADAVTVATTAGFGITTAVVNKPSGQWDVNGAIRTATVTAPTAAWGLSDESAVEHLTVRGDLLSTVTAADIEQMTVTGGLTGATISTDALFNSAAVQLVKLNIAGAVTGSTISAVGNIGTVTAKSLSGSHVYAGYAATSGLPTAANDLSALATITALNLTAGKNTFVNSDLAAYTVTHANLGQITTANSSTSFGVAAHTLSAFTGRLNPGSTLDLTKAQTSSAATLAAYVAKRKLSLGDFTIDLF